MTPRAPLPHALTRARWLLPALAVLLAVACVAVPTALPRALLLTAAALLLVIWHRSRRNPHCCGHFGEDLLEQHPAPTLIYATANGRILAANQAAARTLGWSRAQLLDLRVHDICMEGHSASLQRRLDQLRARTEGTDTLQLQLKRQDGSALPAEITGTPLPCAHQPARMFSVVDRSVERSARLERDQAVRHLHHAQDLAGIVNWQYDLQRQRLLLDARGQQMLQLDPQQAAGGLPLQAALQADDGPSQHALAQLATTLQQPAVIDCRLQLRLADGALLAAQLRCDGVAVHGCLHGTLQDVSENDRVQRALKQSEHQFGQMMRVLPDAVLIVQGQQVIYRNPAAERMFAITATAGQHLALADLLPGASHHSLHDRLTAAPLPRILQRADGSHFEANITPTPLLHAGAECVLLVVHDLSQVELARRQLQASNQELQAMARQLFTVQESERQSISRDLHDDIGQAITAMKLSAHAALEEADPQRRREDLVHILQMADQTVGRLRDLSTLLRPPQLDALGLEAALRWQSTAILRNTEIALELEVATLSQRPAAESEQACFRIAQESLTNVVRHAHAGRVTLRLGEEGGQWLLLDIIDDGDGFQADAPRGLGLIVMRERAHTAGGSVHIHSAPGAGTRIQCRLPFTPPALPTNQIAST